MSEGRFQEMEGDEEIEREEEDDYLVERSILLRDYQLRLLEQAKKQNSIIYLPTGAGKTLIAVHVLCSRTEEIKRPFSQGGKRAFFTTVTKVMVDQMVEVIQTHTKFNSIALTGDMNVDRWSRNEWNKIFEAKQVLILTGEILKTILQLNFITPSDISLLVLDECHHATRDHPYRLIVKAMTEVKTKESPLILGLTSIILNTTPTTAQIEASIRCLEISLNAKVITEPQFEEVMSFSADPVDKIVFYDTDPKTTIMEYILKLYENVITALDTMIVKPSQTPVIPDEGRDFKNRNKAKYVKNCFVHSRKIFEELGLFGGSLGVLCYIILFEKLRLISGDPKTIPVFLYANTELLKLRHSLLAWMGEEESVDYIIKYSSDKMRRLINCIREAKRDGKGRHVAILIFVQQRVMAVVLAFLLKRLSLAGTEFAFLKPEFIVGESNFSKESVCLGLKNKEIMRRFTSHALNAIVATNLLEEGIDVSACNIVVSFDFPVGYPNYFQSRGRARNKESTYYMFIERSDSKNKMKSVTHFKNIEHEVLRTVSQEFRYVESADKLDECEDKLEIDGKCGAIYLDGIIAIKIVQRYCFKLPQDKFTWLSPTCWYYCEGKKKKTFVQLPMNCPLREVIEGEWRDSIKAAKRCCFLRVVKMLYDLGELDHEMNPKSFDIKLEDFSHYFPHYKTEKIDKNLPQPGTHKREQKYKIKFAESLSNCLPTAGTTAYLHVINFTVTFDKPPLDRKVVIYESLLFSGTFALLTSKKLLKIFQFPLFLDMGQINCDLLVNYDELVLTQSEIDDIRECHFSLFQKVTNILKNAQAFDNRNKENSFFVVPVKKNEEDRFVLNWNLIRSDFCKYSTSALVGYKPLSKRGIKRTIENLYERTADKSDALIPSNAFIDQEQFITDDWDSPSINSESKFVMNETDYRYFVIMPNYRNQSLPQQYIVSKFCRELTPLSPFPRENFDNYVSYYKRNYDVDITNMTQPLLKVSPIYNCSNFNKPRKRDLTREKHKTYDELLVPELCDVIPFDRNYFLKALLLPTVLNRIYHVYCVEEFRRKIVSQSGLGAWELPQGAEWPPLEVGKETEDQGTVNNKMKKPKLPLSILKDKTQMKEDSVLDPERFMYETGLCDMEFYVGKVKSFLGEEELKEVEQMMELDENDELIKLCELRSAPIPSLSILKGGSNPAGPDPALLVQACTSKSVNDIVDYERLEILGDAFLKFSATVFLFRNVSLNEGILTSLKGKIVGNRNLMYCALAKGFQDVINVNEFLPSSDWNPPLISIPERLIEGIISRNLDPAVIYRLDIPPAERFSGVFSEATLRKNEEVLQSDDRCYEMASNSLLKYKVLRDKTISDCLEAFIGAYLLALGIPGAFEFLLWLEILPKGEGAYSELIQKPYEDTAGPQNEKEVMSLLQDIFFLELEDTLNYRFQNKALLLEAITHPSYLKNRITQCYQRLELLGDAVLDFLITSYIYEYCGNLSPGSVTDIRSSLVNNITFACLSVRYQLHKYMLSFSTSLSSAINSFVSFQESRNHVVDDNVLVLLEENDYTIAETVQVPKALGDIFESLAGAIFLDSGNSLETVWEIYYILMKREIDEFTRTVPKTPLRLLNEICGDKPYFESRSIEGGVVMVSATIYYECEEVKGYGFGPNKKEAKRSAVKIVLNKILRQGRSSK